MAVCAYLELVVVDEAGLGVHAVGQGLEVDGRGAHGLAGALGLAARTFNIKPGGVRPRGDTHKRPGCRGMQRWVRHPSVA